MRLVISAFYLVAGIFHIAAPHGFLLILPPYIPWPEGVVFLTGICEIAGSVGLMTQRFRRVAGMGLAAYAICVFPANIHHAVNMIPIAGLPDSWWYHGPRLALQPVLVWWALFCAEVTDWPWRSASRA